MIQRETYLSKLRQLKDQNLIKVITGVRRCGKSTS
jgi:predicted AAA+ superfamily ATPase